MVRIRQYRIIMFKILKAVLHPISSILRLYKYIIYKITFKEVHWSDNIISIKYITPKYIKLKPYVYIGPYARIEGVDKYNTITFSPLIELKEGVSIQQGVHITCAKHIVVGKNTAIAAYVTITDIHHPYVDINTPIERQNIEISEVEIGEDCKIYNNVTILPGVHIGKHVTIGANSVVNSNIPDYCVAVGAPAKIIKKYDFEKKEWIKEQKY